MTALVTGVTGFTGGHLARFLVGQGLTVRGLVRPESQGRRGVLEDDGIEVALGDLRDRGAVDAACQGVEVVYHIAASYRTAGQGADAYRAVNVTGTDHVLHGALAAGARRVVHCSTGGVHGHIEQPPATEDAPLAPGDIYQQSKLEAEQHAQRVGQETGLEVVIARPIGIYGPGDMRFLKIFRGLARGRFPMLGSGDVFYHLTYIDDLAKGFMQCAEVPAAAGRTYLLSGPRYTTLKQLVGMIADELGVSPPRWHLPVWPVWVAGAVCEAICVPLKIEPPLYRRRVDFFTKSRAFDSTRARTEIGWNPTVDLKEGIHRTATWYREQGLL